MRIALIVALVSCLWGVALAQDKPAEVAAGRQSYLKACAACHRDDASGSIGPSLLPDHAFKYGRSEAALYTSVAEGHPAKGCPVWKTVLPEKEMRDIVAFLLTLKALSKTPTAAPQSAETWSAWRPYLGPWEGRSSTPLGKADSIVTFRLDLDDHVLIRHNIVHYPNQRHEDLLIVRPVEGGFDASYFDNEGHAIHYTGTAGADGIVLTSADKTGPRFQLRMTLNGESLFTRFLIAPPGKDFKIYTEGSVTRVR